MPIKKGYSRTRIYLEFSKHRHAPIDIITNNKFTKFKGLIVCMQGTNSGAHLSLGEVKMPADIYKITNAIFPSVFHVKNGQVYKQWNGSELSYSEMEFLSETIKKAED